DAPGTLVTPHTAVEKGSVSVQSSVLFVVFDDTIAGVPSAPSAGEILGCEKFLQEGPLNQITKPLDDNLPAPLCTPPGAPNVNGRYFASFALGTAGVVTKAADFSFDCPTCSYDTTGGTTGGTTGAT